MRFICCLSVFKRTLIFRVVYVCQRVPEGDDVYESGDVYSSDSEQTPFPARSTRSVPPALRSLPPLPPEAERIPLSGAGGKVSPKNRILSDPPEAKRPVSEPRTKKAIQPTEGKSNTLDIRETTSTNATPEKAQNKQATVAPSKGQHVTSREVKKQVAADESKRQTESSNSSVSNNVLIDARSRLKPVKPPACQSTKTGMIQQQVEGTGDRSNARDVNQTHSGNKPVTECRRPSKDATALGAEISISSEPRATDAKTKPPSKQPSAAAVESRSVVPSPPLPSRTRQPSPSPQRNAADSPVRALETRTEGISGNRTKAPAVLGSDTSGRIDRHLPSKDTTTVVKSTSPARLTDNKRSGMYVSF